MWVFNPTQPKTYRSPWFVEGKFPFGEGISNTQNKGSRRRLNQFSSVLNDEQKICGPIIRDQPVRNRDLSYPGLNAPNSSTVTADGHHQGKHYSSSIFYNQLYGAAPYWKFGQWAFHYPEYIKVECTGGILSPYDNGSFLLKRSTGFKWDVSNPLGAYEAAVNANTAWSVSYFPCYSIGGRSFPSRFCSWNLSFRPFYYGVGFVNPADDIAPYSWVLNAVNMYNLRTTNYITFTPAPSTGGVRFEYNSLTTLIATWVDTGDLNADAETFRALLQTKMAALTNLGSSQVEVFTVSVDASALVYKVHIDATYYDQLTVLSNTTDSSVVIREDVEGAFFVNEASVMYFTPTNSFSVPNGPCKDTRDIGSFDVPFMTGVPNAGTLPYDNTDYLLVNGETQSRLGLSHGSMQFNKPTRFSLHTYLIGIGVDSDPTFYSYPGWPIVAVYENPARSNSIQRHTFTPIHATVTPIYL